MYDKLSSKAEEFIDHDEIMASINWAEEHKNQNDFIESIIERASDCKGLSHREAALLLACEDEELIQKMFALARKIKQHIYGNRVVMFAPLYLSNYCVNSCVYCPYHTKNTTIPRKKLTQQEIIQEVIALQNMGHKRLALEAGEHPTLNPLEYILESINTIYNIKHKKWSNTTR